jgi:glycosyltransferase involved in cell wall biosynthesis
VRAALVHDFLYVYRGAERVLEALCELLPGAPIYTLFYRPGFCEAIERHPITASALNRLPGDHRRYLPLYRRAIERFDFSGFDLVVSSSYAVAKGAKAPGRHVCYCHTPMRYVWDAVDDYFGTGVKRKLAGPLISRLRRWDRETASRVTEFVANSTGTAERIGRIYGREAVVVAPPVDVEFHTPGEGAREEWYLFAGAFAPYKRADLAIEACRRTGRRLKIVGAGQDEKRIRRLAGRDVEVLGWLDREALREMYRRCRALVFPGEEDFGIVMAEAQACGAPVVALGRGGARDVVEDGGTGVLYGEIHGLGEALERFEALRVDAGRCRERALRFAKPVFLERMRRILGG